MDKPWTPEDEVTDMEAPSSLQDLGDCTACREDQHCGQKITLNIDLKNVTFLRKNLSFLSSR